MKHWVLHDTFKSYVKAERYGQDVFKLGLTLGIKIKQESNKYNLYILPLEGEGN